MQAEVGIEIVLRPPERLPLTGIAPGGYLTSVRRQPKVRYQ